MLELCLTAGLFPLLLASPTVIASDSNPSDKNPETQSNVLGQSVQVRPLQFPMQQLQQTVPVQVPVTAQNGQTVYQTVHFPVQALSSVFNMPTAQMIPQITQVRDIVIDSILYDSKIILINIIIFFIK